MISITVQSSDGTVLACAEHPEETWLSVDRVYQPGDLIRISGPAHLRVQIHGGEGRVGVGAEELVVAPDNRHIPRQGEPHFLQLLHHAEGDQIVEGDDGGGPAG